METFVDRLIEAIDKKQSILNVGLDPQFKLIPVHIRKWARENWGITFEAIANAFLRFNQEIINVVEPFAISVKPQIAFYEAYGHWGIWAFEETVKYAKSRDLIIITDAKREDGDDTAKAYADGHLGEIDVWGVDEQTFGKVPSPLNVDCMTVTAWISQPMVKPFIDMVKQYGKGIFVVCKTSFKPASEIQEMMTADTAERLGRRNWEELAYLVKQWGEGTEGERGYRNVGVVMGATYPSEAVTMRSILPNAWFLIPGYGAQKGGSDEAVVGINKDGYGGVVNSSRAIIFAYSREQFKCDPTDFAEAARKAAEFSRDDLNKALERAGKIPW